MRTLIKTVLLLAMICSTATAQATKEQPGEVALPPAPQVHKQHETLKQAVGVWDAEMLMWMQGPDAEPMMMPAVETNRMLGEMWVMSEFESGPFKGVGQFGYDPMKKKFIGTWVDNMNPFLQTMEGDIDENGDRVMYSEGYNSESQKMEKMKSVGRNVNENEREFRMYRKVGDEWVKSMEIKYTRRGGA